MVGIVGFVGKEKMKAGRNNPDLVRNMCPPLFSASLLCKYKRSVECYIWRQECKYIIILNIYLELNKKKMSGLKLTHIQDLRAPKKKQKYLEFLIVL